MATEDYVESHSSVKVIGVELANWVGAQLTIKKMGIVKPLPIGRYELATRSDSREAQRGDNRLINLGPRTCLRVHY